MNKYRITNPYNNIVRDNISHTTKENKRVCSNIGGGFRDAGYDIMDSIELITPFLEQWRNAKDGIFKTFEQCIKSPVDLENTQEKIVKVMKNHEKNRNEEEYQFYYTNDHLGSSTYITNKEGQITQTLAYLPYGEDWIDLDNQPPYITPYKFNGKEKDQETGYQYFGARYYNDKLSIWLSVDPLSDKYPHLTSYNYCANNPIMLIDPDGRDIDPASESNPYIQEQVQKNAAFAEQYNGLKNDHSAVFSYKKMEGPIAEVIGNETKYTYGNIECEGKNDIGQAKISINYTVGEYKDEPNENWVLYEETAHAGQYVNGDWGFGRRSENEKWGTVGLDITDEVNAKNWAAKALNISPKYNSSNLDKNYNNLSPTKMSAEEGHIDSYKGLNIIPKISYGNNGAYNGGNPNFIYKKPKNSN